MERPDLTVLEGGKMDKKQALEQALAQIDKTFGKGSIMRLGANDKLDIEAISTGSLGLDIALGIGGLPKGRIIEIYGPESSGKTTLALQVVAEAQKKGGICGFVDAEHAIDPGYAKKLGVKVGVVLSPPTPAKALEPVAANVDFVLVMSVNPGFGGQKFMPASLEKIRAIRTMLDNAGNHVPIEIDGGIDLSNIAQAVAGGADILVTGSAIYNTPDPSAATRALKNAATAS